MEAYLQQFQHLQIQLEELTSATNNFDTQNYIGGGGFGKVYKGELSHSKGRSMVAIKRLDPRHGQGIPEFLKEITTLSRYSHENLISLLGFCYQGDEMILVYEHASHGSLDRHLNSPHLTWIQRLKICLDAVKGLNYLHDPRETHHRLIHCDVKSANILLDDQWNAKVSDFGLSISGPANEQQSVVITLAAGTPGYCDPQYAMTHTLTKESDVYSLGVVLFEVLCGTLCCTYSNGHVHHILVPTWVESYKQKKLNDIIFKNPAVQQLDKSSLEIYSDIAYRCLKESREDRPKMAEVVKQLELALEFQMFSEWRPLFDYEKLTKTAEPPLNYRSKGEMNRLLFKGVLLNGGKTWFSLNKKGEHCEMISIADCLESDARGQFENYPQSYKYGSRFPVGVYTYRKDGRVITHVKAQFLSPLVTYTVNLVFKFLYTINKSHTDISLKYKLQGETKTSISHLAYKRKNGWWICELYQFTSDQTIVELTILLDGFINHECINVEGIEFRPLKKVEHKDENRPMLASDSDPDANWEEKLPTDYEDIIKLSKDSMQWISKKEAYLIIRKGFLIDEGTKWFSLDKNGKKYYMISAKAAVIKGRWGMEMLSLPESRFVEAVRYDFTIININLIIQPQLLSSETTYASFLVYKLPKDQSRFEPPLNVMVCGASSDYSWNIYLVSPQTPVIGPKADQNTHNPVYRPKIKGIPQQRNDGWMEVQIFEFRIPTATRTNIHTHLAMTTRGNLICFGLTIQGIEFRPT